MRVPSGPCSTNRHEPPTRKSLSHSTSYQPRGRNHRFSSSHFVKASKTIERGASNSRTILTSRSLGVVTLRVPVFSMGRRVVGGNQLLGAIVRAVRRYFS